jgi:hypothetical protein
MGLIDEAEDGLLLFLAGAGFPLGGFIDVGEAD